MIGKRKTNVFHVVFTLKNSRYEFQKIKRRKPVGYIASTLPFIDGIEEEIIVEVLSDVAAELNLDLIALNFCGDHVHCLICCEIELLPKIMLLWKGKTAYNFNRRLSTKLNDTYARNGINNNQGLWAKGYFKKALKNENELFNTINYIINNRSKHSLKPLSLKLSEKIASTIKK